MFNTRLIVAFCLVYLECQILTGLKETVNEEAPCGGMSSIDGLTLKAWPASVQDWKIVNPIS